MKPAKTARITPSPVGRLGGMATDPTSTPIAGATLVSGTSRSPCIRLGRPRRSFSATTAVVRARVRLRPVRHRLPRSQARYRPRPVTLFGGFAPIILTWQISSSGSLLSPSYNLITVAAISLIGMLVIRSRRYVDR
jgi:hypothetical protein